MLILPVLQNSSTGSGLTNDGRLGAEIREFEPGIAKVNSFKIANLLKGSITIKLFDKNYTLCFNYLTTN